jgi:hypothetical protein
MSTRKKYNEAYYVCLNQLYDFRDETKLIKQNANFDDKFHELIISTTREKIFNELIKIFRLVKTNNKQEILERTSKLTKRIKLHLHQLKKNKEEELEDQTMYFTHALKIIYNLCINL